MLSYQRHTGGSYHIMDYELRIIVEKVAISSQEVIKRDTITSYALQCPTSIVELGLRHAGLKLEKLSPGASSQDFTVKAYFRTTYNVHSQ
jgi:hypothetical protein